MGLQFKLDSVSLRSMYLHPGIEPETSSQSRIKGASEISGRLERRAEGGGAPLRTLVAFAHEQD